jgi:hypothetical protein
MTATRKNLVLFVANSPSLYSDVNPRRETLVLFSLLYPLREESILICACLPFASTWKDGWSSSFVHMKKRRRARSVTRFFIWWHCCFCLLLTKKSHALRQVMNICPINGIFKINLKGKVMGGGVWPGTARSYFIDSVVGEVRLWEVNDFRTCRTTSQQDPIFDTGDLRQGFDLYD